MLMSIDRLHLDFCFAVLGLSQGAYGYILIAIGQPMPFSVHFCVSTFTAIVNSICMVAPTPPDCDAPGTHPLLGGMAGFRLRQLQLRAAEYLDRTLRL